MKAVVPECKFVPGKSIAVPAKRTNAGDAPDPAGPRERCASDAAVTDARGAGKASVTAVAHAAVAHAAVTATAMSSATPGKRRKRGAGTDRCYCGQYDHQLAHDGYLPLWQKSQRARCSAGEIHVALPSASKSKDTSASVDYAISNRGEMFK
jgi:hypothetical protein